MSGKKNYSHNSPVIGILYGEGIGQEIIDVSLSILSAASQVTGRAFDLRMGGLIGKNALEAQGKPLTEDVIQFIRDIFDEGGSILCGPGGARFVYELRAHFGLYYKLSPINPISALDDVRLIQKTSLSNIDILMIRENVGGLYFGKSRSGVDEEGFRFSELTFGYSELEINKILSVAEHYSLQRNKKICLVLKKDAIQDITNLWLDCIEKHKKNHPDIQWQFLDIDNACYQLISNPNEFDVIVSPNM
jgi:3-isopropylmalate dehydrogenase